MFHLYSVPLCYTLIINDKLRSSVFSLGSSTDEVIRDLSYCEEMKSGAICNLDTEK
jgi:hypothetical protein